MHGHKSSHLPIRYFLALLWAHPILHISTIRVNIKTNLNSLLIRILLANKAVRNKTQPHPHNVVLLCRFPYPLWVHVAGHGLPRCRALLIGQTDGRHANQEVHGRVIRVRIVSLLLSFPFSLLLFLSRLTFISLSLSVFCLFDFNSVSSSLSFKLWQVVYVCYFVKFSRALPWSFFLFL